MLISLSDQIKAIYKIAADNYRIKEIKIFFLAPNPREAGSSTLNIKKEVSNEANFQWISFQLLFSTKELKYYIYSIPLETSGKGKPPDIVFESDDDWSGVNKDKPDKKIVPGDIKRMFPKILKGPNLFPARSFPFGIPTNYINVDASDKGNSYSSEEFKKFFDNDFYIVLNPKSKKLENPFGDHIEPAGKTYPEKEEENKK